VGIRVRSSASIHPVTSARLHLHSTSDDAVTKVTTEPTERHADPDTADRPSDLEQAVATAVEAPAGNGNPRHPPPSKGHLSDAQKRLGW
jgi:hypothetical protein